MKRRSPVATLVGAVPGALPPLIGWTAARGALAAGGWSLFAIVFLWQIPHFMAIAWMYRDDYATAGFPDAAGRRAGRRADRPAGACSTRVALLPVSLLPSLVGVSGLVYFWVALVARRRAPRRWRRASRRCDPRRRGPRAVLGSIIYLPLIWAAMILDH